MIPARFLDRMFKLESETNELKLWLEQKATTEYIAWKADNPKDRTAKEKVLDQLKLNNVSWLEKEQEYQTVKFSYDKAKTVVQILKETLPVMSNKDFMGKEDWDNLISEYEKILEE